MLPPVVQTVSQSDLAPQVNLSRLSPAAKASAWAAIQRNNPALAELLQDPAFRALQQAFDGEVTVDQHELEG